MTERYAHSSIEALALRKEARESWEYVISDRIVYLSELANLDLGIAKDYGCGRLWFEVYFRVHDSSGDADFKAIIEFAHRPPRCGPGRQPKSQVPCGGSDELMFIEPVQFVKDAKQFLGIPSLVRLKVLNRSHGFDGDPINSAAEASRIGLPVQRKSVVAVDGVSCEVDQEAGQMIEGRSHIVAGVAHDQAEMNGRVCENLHAEDIAAIFGIEIASDSGWP